MSYFPIIELIERAIKDSLRWFFNTFLFSTRELRTETELYFQTGETSFRYFEWLNLARMRHAYPERWKIIILDFFGAYLKLFLTGAALALVCISFADRLFA